MIFNSNSCVALAVRAPRFVLMALALFCALLCSYGESQSRELRFVVTDIVGLEELQTEYGAFQKLLSEISGVELRFFPVTNRTAAVESLKAKKIDVVLTGPAEYVIFRAPTLSRSSVSRAPTISPR
jgi:phosphonate transport system substrate-binding protein